jgi:hypothetical protein
LKNLILIFGGIALAIAAIKKVKQSNSGSLAGTIDPATGTIFMPGSGGTVYSQDPLTGENHIVVESHAIEMAMLPSQVSVPKPGQIVSGFVIQGIGNGPLYNFNGTWLPAGTTLLNGQTNEKVYIADYGPVFTVPEPQTLPIPTIFVDFGPTDLCDNHPYTAACGGG